MSAAKPRHFSRRLLTSLKEADADYWLISIAAIPFGTFGEMLGRDSCTAGPEPCVMHEGCGESCANRWRGMLYGMTNRAGWTGHDPNNNAGVYDPRTPSCKCRAMLWLESHALA